MNSNTRDSYFRGSPEEFARVQIAMAHNWYERLKKQGIDVDAYISRRHDAYLGRWREALNFIGPKSSVLDVGGGFGFDRLYALLKEREICYSYADIDSKAVAVSANRAAPYGFSAENFRQSLNTNLPFPADSYDALFSSHCIEHSDNLLSTFSEIRRVLRPDGVLCMAVPLGWDASIEHLYFFGPDEWIALICACGFNITNAHIGCSYPENGYDLFVAATRTESLSDLPFEIENFSKAHWEFVDFRDACFAYSGDWEMRSDLTIGLNRFSRFELRLPDDTNHVKLLVNRHDWSGRAHFTCGLTSTQLDLYSWFSYIAAVDFTSDMPPSSTTTLAGTVFGRTSCSKSAQMVITGALLPQKDG